VDYTEQQKVKFKRQFAARRNRQIAMVVPILVIVVVATVLTDGTTGAALGIPRVAAWHSWDSSPLRWFSACATGGAQPATSISARARCRTIARIAGSSYGERKKKDSPFLPSSLPPV
jgi:hypothetical protein